MGLTYQMKMKIPFDMADMNGHIKLPDVILLSLQVSGMQSIELGVSDKDMLEQHNLVWIITDYDIDVTRLPRFAEEITIETEALTYNRLFCYRRFTIFDEAGEAIIKMNPNITQEELVKIIGIKSTAIEDNIKFLKENEYIERKGSKKTGYCMGYFD